MKYIRTKDGKILNLIAYKEDGEINGGIKYTSKLNGSHLFIQKNNILKQADMIEELCDEFVLDHPLFGDSCKCLYHSFEKAKNGIKKRSDNAHNLYDFNIYGAIWTDKGLIYKARMKGIFPNGEIDWELL